MEVSSIQPLDDNDLLLNELSEREEKREKNFKLTRTILKNNSSLLFSVRTNINSKTDVYIEENKKIIADMTVFDNEERGYSHAIEKFLEIRLLKYFFMEGKLAPQEEVLPCTDEEYLGAIFGFAQELTRYSIRQAIEGNDANIKLCNEILTQINYKMIEFDFRNGPLRRKYDGLKYAVKKIEEILYELSLSDHKEDESTDNNNESSKKRKLEESGSSDSTATTTTTTTTTPTTINFDLIDSLDIDRIRIRYETNDKLREDVIKLSRDVQKFSKQAIFSVHRNNLSDSKSKCAQAFGIIENILHKIEEHTSLRQGSFSNSLEEYAEAILTIEWVENKRIIPKSSLKFINTDEYIGALADFTGEIGRIAVNKASSRDEIAVKEILQADLRIVYSLMGLNLNGKFHKKVVEANQNLKKVEEILYDLCLLKKGGRMGRDRVKESNAEDVAS